MEKYLRKLNRTSRHSYGVVIPKELIEKYGWKGKQKLTLEDKDGEKLKLEIGKKDNFKCSYFQYEFRTLRHPRKIYEM